MDKSKFFKCDCHSHGIEILVDDVDGIKEVFFMPWKYDFHSGKVPFMVRLKTSFRYLFSREDLVTNEVILDDKKALEMADWIRDQLLNKKV